ncbi:crotonase [Desulfonema ishimotonii]|uniref:Crotonase n=1 Tax=Desulfonema ishimotonii TaxID=45657 RepID=A0A401FTF2_9BACT|nr:enoyl-CoA hydratase-related protein [Desulfonema ishimotonii]GBC60233.1 crotonase [Desulfonema ishimotonii]
MSFNTIIYEQDGGIGIVTLNRPRSMNALNNELIRELGAVLDEIAGDGTISAVIIRGHEKVFAAGADISELSRIQTPAQAHQFVTRVHLLFDRIENLPKPVIAAVSGLALGGGCELSMACDIRIAAENAVFGQPEIKIGVIPGGGGTQRLPRLVGLGRAKELLFTGDPVDAQEAWRIGLVSRVVPTASLGDEARKMATGFTARPALALQMIKMAVNTGINMDLRSALSHEARCFEWLFSTLDQKEGMRAFMEKRRPEFKGI